MDKIARCLQGFTSTSTRSSFGFREAMASASVPPKDSPKRYIGLLGFSLASLRTVSSTKLTSPVWRKTQSMHQIFLTIRRLDTRQQLILRMNARPGSRTDGLLQFQCLKTPLCILVSLIPPLEERVSIAREELPLKARSFYDVLFTASPRVLTFKRCTIRQRNAQAPQFKQSAQKKSKCSLCAWYECKLASS